MSEPAVIRWPAPRANEAAAKIKATACDCLIDMIAIDGCDIEKRLHTVSLSVFAGVCLFFVHASVCLCLCVGVVCSYLVEISESVGPP